MSVLYSAAYMVCFLRKCRHTEANLMKTFLNEKKLVRNFHTVFEAMFCYLLCFVLFILKVLEKN